MKFKTIFMLCCTILLTIFLTVNRDAVEFDFLIGEPVPVSKLIVIGVCIVIGFIIGYLAGRPKRTLESYDTELDKQHIDPNSSENPKQTTLSEEDRNYIS
ncbi:MAG: LapA family protein [Pedobacter sp.]|nr:MAG: LapA family protein [Pedobacter sp.]